METSVPLLLIPDVPCPLHGERGLVTLDRGAEWVRLYRKHLSLPKIFSALWKHGGFV